MGVLVPDGFDGHGLEFYTIDQAECRRIDPEMYNALRQVAASDIMNLVDSGRATMTIDENFYVWYELNE
jgi:hypothetical protein